MVGSLHEYFGFFNNLIREPFDMIFLDAVEFCIVDYSTVEYDNPGILFAYGFLEENEIFGNRHYRAGLASKATFVILY